MKTLFCIALPLALSPILSAQKAEVKHRVEVKEVKVEVQQTPLFQVTGPKEKRIDPKYWIEIEAELEVETKEGRGVVPFISELQATWYAVIKDEVGEKREPVLLKGRSEYRMVRTAGGEAFLSAYIEPNVLERLTGKERPSESDLLAFAVVVSGTDIATEGKFAKELFKSEGEKGKWWENWKREIKEDFIVPKSTTPFAPLWADRYPPEKVE